MRTDDDSWGIAGKVGSTALATAMVRAAENVRSGGLFTDPFAQCFLDAAVAQGWRNPYATEAWHRNDYEDPATAAFRQASTDCAVCRTRFIDDFLRAGTDRQVVLLAAGLDTRAWRLPWTEGSVVYELDQPGVLDFKSETMAAHATRPSARRCAVPIDLRDDWRRHCWQLGLTPPPPPFGLPRGWCRICRRPDRTCCSNASRH